MQRSRQGKMRPVNLAVHLQLRILLVKIFNGHRNACWKSGVRQLREALRKADVLTLDAGAIKEEEG